MRPDPQADARFMREALMLAQEAAAAGEVPVGAVVVKDGRMIAAGFNRRETGKSALAHAEIEAIREACRILGGWRLSGCTLYVTLEPCPMCAGAIINARIDRVVYGARDPKAGCAGSLINLFAVGFNHTPLITAGVMAEECAAILSNFFENKRKSN